MQPAIDRPVPDQEQHTDHQADDERDEDEGSHQAILAARRANSQPPHTACRRGEAPVKVA
jgi:hypothetical protein